MTNPPEDDAGSAVAITLVVGIAVVGLASYLPMFFASPRGFGLPCSMLLLCPALLVESSIVWLGVPLVFWAWAPGLFLRSASYPRRSVVLAAVVALASVIWHVAAWGWALEHRAFLNQVLVSLPASAALGTASVLLAIRCRRRPSFALNLTGHAILFVWVFTSAVPYIGELP